MAFCALFSTTSAPAAGAQVHAACGASAPGAARCFALVVTPAGTAGARSTSVSGYGPAQLHTAYRLPVSGGAGQTIAIVDAYDDPTAAQDLAVYRRHFGLPACTASTGCFRKVNQRGHHGGFPPADVGWGIEISLDLDMVSAACPRCHILLVEADSSFLSDLGAAEDSAVGLGVAAVSNSWGAQEFNGMHQFAGDFHHPGTAILVASGDFGFGPANFPAVLHDVIAVGGTTLTLAPTDRGYSEQAWYAASSGCSAYVAKPRWQHDTHCSMRTVADVSADADPFPGLAVYDTSIPPDFYGLNPGWFPVGGTSASAPFIAGVVGLAGNGSTLQPSHIYQHSAAFFDVVGGSNGDCGGDYLCTGRKGYDAPTGVGTPDGSGGL